MTVIPFPKMRLATRAAEATAHIERSDGEPLPCTLLDLTWRGALINASEIILPDAFSLLLDRPTSGRRRCRVVRRDRHLVSVVFEAEA